MLTLKQKIIGTLVGTAMFFGIATNARPMMIMDQIPYCGQHVIKIGETLTSIAKKYGTSVEYILDNTTNRKQIKNPDLIFPGQVLYGLPKSTTISTQSDKEFIANALGRYNPLCSDANNKF